MCMQTANPYPPTHSHSPTEPMAPSAPLSPVTVVAKPESSHWTFEEDQKLLAAIHLRGTVLDRAGKTVIGSWNAVAAEMGFADIAKGARRCSRRWFAMHPSNEAAMEVRRAQARDREARALRAQTNLIDRFEAPELDELLSALQGSERVTEDVEAPVVVEALADTDSPLDLSLLQMPVGDSELALVPTPRRARRTRKPLNRKVRARNLACNETLEWESERKIPPIGKVALTYAFKSTNLDVVYRFWSTRYAKELCGENVKAKHERAHASRLARIRKLRREWRLEWQSQLFQ